MKSKLYPYLKLKAFCLLIAVVSFSISAQAQMGVSNSGNNPDPSAMLDVESNSKGMLIPRMSSGDRTSILSPALGLMVFDTTTTSFWFYGGAGWQELSADADADATNEIQDLSSSVSGTNRTINISGGTGTTISVADNDNDASNEIQDLSSSIAGTNRTINISGGVGTTISVADNDNDSNNEIQVLSINGDTIFLSSGGFVLIPNDGDWQDQDSGIRRNDPVGINTNLFDNKLHVRETSSIPTAAIWAEGVFGPTYGQLGVQGDDDHEGIADLDISGQEIGVLGISQGGSSTDNYGVLGYSNNWGGQFRHQSSGNVVNLGGTLNAIQILDGNEAFGKVLTSDALGNGTWEESGWLVNGSNLTTSASITAVGLFEPTPLADVHLDQSNATTAGVGGMRFQWSSTYWKLFHSGVHFSFVDDGTRVAYVEGGTGNYVQPSDGGLKKNVSPLPNLLNRFLQLEPVSYHYNHMSDEDTKVVGFIAQEVEALFPDLVRESEEGLKGLSYSDFAVLSVKAIKEQQEQIETLQQQVEALMELLGE